MVQGYLSPSVNDPLPSEYNSLIYCKTNIGGYFFDGIMNINHTRELEITENPVETGASIVDHSYVKPATITMEVLMSDVHRSIYPGQFDGAKSRSFAAWDVLNKIQSSRIPCSVFTPLGLYNNMLVSSIEATEDALESKCESQASKKGERDREGGKNPRNLRTTFNYSNEALA